MKTNSIRRIGIQIVLTSSVCGATYGLTGCLSSVATNFNPCGTVLTCDPAEWDLMLMDPTEPNYDYNPTCSIPGLLNCDTPITGVAGAADATTTTSNTSTTSSTRGSGTNNNNLLGGFGT
jgi:hypothetical protein